MAYSVPYIVGFAAAVCGVCSIFVAGSAVALKDRQDQNRVLDRQGKVLQVAGLVEKGEHLSPDELTKRFEDNIEAKLLDLSTDQIVDATEKEIESFDQRAAAKDPETSKAAPPNNAKVLRVPNRALVYMVMNGDEVEQLVLPIEGKGLWSTLYGYIALDADGETIRGITYYQHGETPGLGGEVDNPKWKALWPGRKVYRGDEVAIEVVKGQAGPVAEDPYKVDGLSGATLTSRGVTHMLNFWLGPEGFQPFIEDFAAEHGGGES